MEIAFAMPLMQSTAAKSNPSFFIVVVSSVSNLTTLRLRYLIIAGKQDVTKSVSLRDQRVPANDLRKKMGGMISHPAHQ
jgi:hypothetical protein